ncbi:hypothetical protein ATI61_12354 [Archangium gephyra]|uniref:Uncharacterized protein n=1 Tax=Archangium gephyra TaxID=48 RepID=A0AAC8TJ40_9BACT|nr:hypothetical protein [Archangium gephyra]AKJ07500.1 Hypothetical protein AA314_09126 [Archangium gephyra]REG19103.1 hypothetical protein ATI61_12354 [Archangium gephyra]
MRERLRAALLLALLLGLSPTLAVATEPTAVVAPAVEEEPASDEEDAEEHDANWVPGYEEVPGQAVELSESALKATVLNSVLRPAGGYIPLEVVLFNPGATPHAVSIRVESQRVGRSQVSTRQVEVGARQRLSAWIPVPSTAQGGLVRLSSPGGAFRSFNFYSVDPSGQPVLVLGSEQAFQSGTKLPRVKDKPKLSVRFIPPQDAPRELALYVGHRMVVVAGDVTAIPADAWSALEAYAATGGHLVLLRPPRDVVARLPLLTQTPTGVLPYGFGRLRVCAKAQECGDGLLADVNLLEEPAQAPVSVVAPAGPPPSWQRGPFNSNHLLNNGEAPLLPGVQAPVGRFLLLITLFVLAVGPGGLMLARRKGPVALLIAVPSVALVTCLAIVAWSVLVEGFVIHAARYSLIWLDRDRDRALMVGVGGYYANLEPEGLHVPAMAALLGPDVDWESQATEADWTNGMAVTGGFLPSRTYREWGEVAMLPSRARLTVRREGQGLRVQNALGAPLASGHVRLGGKLWQLPALADGAEGEATLAPATGDKVSFLQVVDFSASVNHRFSRVAWRTLDEPLPEGGFAAKLGGPGLLPLSALPVELHEGLHFVRGRVDAP